MTSMKENKLLWIVALVSGFCCAVVIAYVVWHKHQEDSDPYVRAARASHMDVATFKRQMNLLGKVFATHQLSPQDWSDLERYYYSKNPNERVEVVNVLSYAYIPPERKAEALRMVRQLYNQLPSTVPDFKTDPQGAIEAFHGSAALLPLFAVDLYKLGAPEWKTAALNALKICPPDTLPFEIRSFKNSGLWSQLHWQGEQ